MTRLFCGITFALCLVLGSVTVGCGESGNVEIEQDDSAEAAAEDAAIEAQLQKDLAREAADQVE